MKIFKRGERRTPVVEATRLPGKTADGKNIVLVKRIGTKVDVRKVAKVKL